MPVPAKWLLPTDDPRVRRNRAEVLAFRPAAEADEAVLLAQSPPQPRPAPVLPDAPLEEPPVGRARPAPPPIDPARVRALLDAGSDPGAGRLASDPVRSRRELMQLFTDLDQLARRLTGGATGG